MFVSAKMRVSDVENHHWTPYTRARSLARHVLCGRGARSLTAAALVPHVVPSWPRGASSGRRVESGGLCGSTGEAGVHAVASAVYVGAAPLARRNDDGDGASGGASSGASDRSAHTSGGEGAEGAGRKAAAACAPAGARLVSSADAGSATA